MKSSHLKHAAFALAIAAATGSQAQIIVDVYTGIGNDATGGAPYTGFTGSFNTPDIQFGTSTGFNWHPFELSVFGADFNGGLKVPSDGNYSFSMESDDGSLFFIDGNLIIDNGGGHGPATISNNVNLTAGVHTFEVQFYEDFGGESGVDLNLPEGVTFTSVPEPAEMTVLAGSAVAAFALYRRLARRPATGR